MKNISWDQYFMSLAKISALRSKDPNTKVGATIVNNKNIVIGLGYNGMPKGDDDFSWDREGDDITNTKYPYVVHAEMNAILNSTKSVEGAILYTTLFPCSSCSKLIAQAGITSVIYYSDKYDKTKDNEIAKKIFKKLKIKIKKLDVFNIEIKN